MHYDTYHGHYDGVFDWDHHVDAGHHDHHHMVGPYLGPGFHCDHMFPIVSTIGKGPKGDSLIVEYKDDGTQEILIDTDQFMKKGEGGFLELGSVPETKTADDFLQIGAEAKRDGISDSDGFYTKAQSDDKFETIADAKTHAPKRWVTGSNENGIDELVKDGYEDLRYDGEDPNVSDAIHIVNDKIKPIKSEIDKIWDELGDLINGISIGDTTIKVDSLLAPLNAASVRIPSSASKTDTIFYVPLTIDQNNLTAYSNAISYTRSPGSAGSFYTWRTVDGEVCDSAPSATFVEGKTFRGLQIGRSGKIALSANVRVLCDGSERPDLTMLRFRRQDNSWYGAALMKSRGCDVGQAASSVTSGNHNLYEIKISPFLCHIKKDDVIGLVVGTNSSSYKEFKSGSFWSPCLFAQYVNFVYDDVIEIDSGDED